MATRIAQQLAPFQETAELALIECAKTPRVGVRRRRTAPLRPRSARHARPHCAGSSAHKCPRQPRPHASPLGRAAPRAACAHTCARVCSAARPDVKRLIERASKTLSNKANSGPRDRARRAQRSRIMNVRRSRRAGVSPSLKRAALRAPPRRRPSNTLYAAISAGMPPRARAGAHHDDMAAAC